MTYQLGAEIDEYAPNLGIDFKLCHALSGLESIFESVTQGDTWAGMSNPFRVFEAKIYMHDHV